MVRSTEFELSVPRGSIVRVTDKKTGPIARGPETPSSLAERLKKVGLEPLYLIEGPESFLRDQALAVLRGLAEGAPAETQFEGSKAPLATVLDEVRTLPFLASHRLVVVSEAEEFLKANAEDLEPFFAQCMARKTALRQGEKVEPSRSALVLVTDGLDGRFKYSKSARESGVRVKCEPPEANDLLSFARDRAKARGRTFERGADVALLDRFSGGAGICVDLGTLDGEVAKLCASGEGPITKAKVESLASGLTAEDTFAVVGAIGRGDLKGALEALRSLFRDGAIVDGERKRDPRAIAPILVGLLVWDLGRLFKGRAALDAGRSSNAAISEAKAFRDKETFLARVRAVKTPDLRNAHALLREADAQLKDGGDPVAVLTTVVSRLTLLAPRRPLSATRG